MQATILGRLLVVRRRMRRLLVYEGVAKILLTALAFALISFIMDWRFELSRVTRSLYLVVGAITLAYLLLRYIISPLVAKWHPMDIAGAIDLHGFAHIGQAISPKLATILQMDRVSDDHSVPLADEAARQSFWALQEIEFEQRISSQHRRRSLIGIGIGVVLPLIIFFLLSADLRTAWLGRWVRLAEIPWPRNTQIEVLGLTNGRLIVPRGEPQSLRIQIFHKKDEVPQRVRIELRQSGRKPERSTLLRDGTGQFEYELPGMWSNASLRIWAGDARRGPVTIVPIERPQLVKVQLRHQHPWDHELQIHDFDRGDGAISLLPKTTVELILASNVEIETLETEWNIDQPPRIRRVDAKTFLASWEHAQEIQLKTRLVGRDAGLKSQRRLFSIGRKRDRVPSMTMRPQGVRRRVTPTARIPLELVARDDFGISHVSVHMTMNRLAKVELPEVGSSADSAPASESNPDASETELSKILFGPNGDSRERILELEQIYHLAAWNLHAGDSIQIQARAVDTCYLGEQTTRSPQITFSIVKPQELFREILMKQQQLRARLRRATDQAIQLKDDLVVAQFPDDGKKLVRNHRLIQREISTVHRGLTNTVTEMKWNDLGGPESIALIQTNVLKPLQQLSDQTLGQQRSLLENLSKNDQLSPDESIELQTQIVNELQRVLKNMAQWDSFVDVVNQLDTIIKLQQKLKDNTQKLKEKEVESVFED